MSFYNMLFGENQSSELLLKILGITENDIPRYRDIYWNGKHIVIYTRTGGGNREFYENEESKILNYGEEYGKDYNGPYNDDLRKIDGFICDFNDDYDCTYASFLYEVPKKYLDIIKGIPESLSPAEKWKIAFEMLEGK